jgi:chromosome segregation protein
MDDVIFAGAAKRQALGRAEVSLTIDNTGGVLPIEFTEVTLSRILFRTGDSEYAINGVPCRLLDIQELLSDSGVGRQQHVIISQGQIDAVLNARPEDRRLIIEEAAGVLKFRRRKEKAERRLDATEANLTRLQDLLREVRRQLRPLEKQADAARRHGAVVAELTALRVHVAGREIERLRGRLAQGQRTRTEHGHAEREVRSLLRRLDTEVAAAEIELTSMGGDDLGDALVRFESLRERARGLAAVLAERRRGIERDRGAFVDQAVVASLESDAARLVAELAEVDASLAELAPASAGVAQAEDDLELARERFQQEWSEGVAQPTGAAAEVRGELAAVRASVQRNEAEVGRDANRLAALDEKLVRLAADAERLAAQVASAEAAAPRLADAVVEADRNRTAAEARAEQADDARRSAEAELHASSARADALASALDAARARAGAERLASIDGVVGTLLDVVEVDEGWEVAFETAAGEAVAAVVVASVDAGRRALEELRRGSVAGAVLALGAGRPGPSSSLTEGSVRAHVRGIRPGVDDLLDALVGSAVMVPTWSEAVDRALADPEAIVVTAEGGRFGPSGWRVGATGSGATGAALVEARERAAAAEVAAGSATQAASEARELLAAARRSEAEASKEQERATSAGAAAAAGLRRAERDRSDVTAEAEGLRAEVGELADRARRDAERVTELEARLPTLEAEDALLAEQGRAMGEARGRLEARSRQVSELRNDLQVRSAGLTERHQFLEQRTVEVDRRLARHATERADAEQRRMDLDRRAVATDRLSALVAGRLQAVDGELGELRERRRLQSEATRAVAARLDGLRTERSAQEKALAELRERVQRAELADGEVRVRLEGAVEAVRRDLDIEPDAAVSAPAPELAEGVSATARVRELERDLRIMGPINPLALEEFQALQERHEFTQTQLEDVKSSRRDLSKVIRAIDAEIVSVFASAFADVSQNFQDLFETLFPGGKGRLRLTAPDDLLTTGIEVEARPSGKNVRKLSLLSGGERSLTALAYLFAVFRARPSPFYVMDEVEAALDDVNLHRFLDLVREFRQEAQLIIVSHQKRTMEAADCLYGVTMKPGGSSQVVSEKVRN